MTDFRLVCSLHAHSGGTVPDLHRIHYSPLSLIRYQRHSNIYSVLLIPRSATACSKSARAVLKPGQLSDRRCEREGSLLFPTRSTQRVSETQKKNALRADTKRNAKDLAAKRSKAEQKTQFRFRQNAVNRHVSGLTSRWRHHSDRLEGHLTLFHAPSKWLRLTYIDF